MTNSKFLRVQGIETFLDTECFTTVAVLIGSYLHVATTDVQNITRLANEMEKVGFLITCIVLSYNSHMYMVSTYFQ